MKGTTWEASLRSVLCMSGLVIVGCGSPPAAETPPPSSADAYADETPAAPEPASEKPTPAGETKSTTESAGPLPAADENGETRTVEAIAAFVKERREKVRPCYDAVQKVQRSVKGDLVIRLVLDPKGKVKKAEYRKNDSTIDSEQMAECVITEMKAWQFPASSRGMETEVDYPFNFNPRR